MATLPYMQLYVADYLADTFHLTTVEHGAYLLMLFNYWQTEKPLQCKRIPSVIRMDNEGFAQIEETLKEFFHINENGYWIHPRIENDLEKVREKSKKASKSSKARWEENAKNKASESVCNANASSNAKQTVSHKDKDKDKDKDTITVSGFIKPTIQQLQSKIIENNYNVDPERFYNHYESNGWKVGKNKMKSWVSALANWHKTANDRQQPKSFREQDAQRTDDAVDAFLQARAAGFDLRNIGGDDMHDVEVLER